MTAAHTVLERTKWLQELRELASAGRLLRVASAYPPGQVAAAERPMDAGSLRGRGVIVFANFDG
jgi:hypothetical protein